RPATAVKFRQLLFYRRNLFPIVIPPLRERLEDSPPLIAHFLAAAAARLGRAPKSVAPDAYRALLAHDWPGNVRELEHGVEQATVLAAGDEIELDDLPAELRANPAAVAISSLPVEAARPDPAGGFKESKQPVIEQFERRF